MSDEENIQPNTADTESSGVSKPEPTTAEAPVPFDEVEKLLHVSDATATRYLEILEKEEKIKQVGKTGKRVSYIKI